jgi:glycosyltransferase involved in cell wall biosynthesis
MRVAHVITRLIVGGAQENTIETCDILRRVHGWDVFLLTGPPIGPEGELLSDVRRRNIPHVLVPQMRRAVNPWRDGLALLDLVRRLRRIRPAVVHTHSSKAGLLGRLAASAARVPIVVHHIRGLPFHPYCPRAANAAFMLAERLAATVTDQFICVAHAMTDGAVGAGVAPHERFVVIRSGMDVSLYDDASRHRGAMRRRFGFEQHDIVIGKVARLFSLKGHEFLIRAAPRVVERCARARFLFIGEGILRDSLAGLAESLGVRDRIVFAGLMPPAEIPAAISAMDAVVHTSLREGLARVLVQALLCGKPVVTYAMDGAPEVIVEGETGRLVPPESVEELAESLLWTVEHPEEAGRMALEGRRRVLEEFRIEDTARQTDRLYRRLLASRGIAVAGEVPTSRPRL